MEKEENGYKIEISVVVSRKQQYDTITIASKKVEEEYQSININTPAKELNRKITELLADVKSSIADMLYTKEERKKENKDE